MTRTELDSYLLAGSRSLVLMALTVDGTAPDDAAISAWLDFAIGDALRAIGYPSALFSGVVDADLDAVPAADSEKLLLFSLWKQKIQLRGSLALCDMTQGPQSQKLSQLTAGLDAEIARLEAELKERYPDLFGNTLTVGRIRLASSSRRAASANDFT